MHSEGALQNSRDGADVVPAEQMKANREHLSKLLKEQGIQAVPHGFRASFRGWMAEECPREARREAALAHQVKGRLGRHTRSMPFEHRCRLMRDGARTSMEY